MNNLLMTNALSVKINHCFIHFEFISRQNIYLSQDGSARKHPLLINAQFGSKKNELKDYVAQNFPANIVLFMQTFW